MGNSRAFDGTPGADTFLSSCAAGKSVKCRVLVWGANQLRFAFLSISQFPWTLSISSLVCIASRGLRKNDSCENTDRYRKNLVSFGERVRPSRTSMGGQITRNHACAWICARNSNVISTKKKSFFCLPNYLSVGFNVVNTLLAIAVRGVHWTNMLQQCSYGTRTISDRPVNLKKKDENIRRSSFNLHFYHALIYHIPVHENGIYLV